MVNLRNNPWLAGLTVLLVGYSVITGLLLLLPAYIELTFTFTMAPYAIMGAVLRFYVRTDLRGRFRYFLAVLPAFVVLTLSAFSLANIERANYPTRQYAIWHNMAIGDAIFTSIAVLIALPDILKILRQLVRRFHRTGNDI